MPKQLKSGRKPSPNSPSVTSGDRKRGMLTLNKRPAERRSVRLEVDWRDLVAEQVPITLTADELCQAHLRELRMSDSPSEADWQSFHRRFLADFGDLPLRDHSVRVWEAWLKARALDPKPLADKTVSTLLELASALFNFAIRQGAMERNPIRDLPREVRPSRRPADPGRPRRAVLRCADLRTIFDAAADVDDGDFFGKLFYAAGLVLGGRFGELSAVRYRNYDAKVVPLGSLTLDEQWHTKSQKFRLPKDGLPKVVPVHPELARLLALAPAAFYRRVGRLPTKDDPLFTYFRRRKNGKYERVPRHWNQRTVLEHWKAFQRTVLPPCPDGHRTVHSLRHTFITRMRSAGADPFAVRMLTHPATTRRNGDAHTDYIHVDWGGLCEAFLTLDFTKEVLEPKQHALDLSGNVPGTG